MDVFDSDEEESLGESAGEENGMMLDGSTDNGKFYEADCRVN